MRVLVLGAGAREHALGWALARSRDLRLLFGPGNAGTHALGTNIPDLDPLDPAAVADEARSNRVDLVVVGPEEPLARGVADRLRADGIPVFGPSCASARLETSKAFSKAFMERWNVPTAAGTTYRDYESFRRHVMGSPGPLVVKKSGLAAGKGVLVGADPRTTLDFGRGILENDLLVVEDLLQGYELSLFVLMDGRDHVVLPACADHKKAMDGDQGPNTGGMGAVCPVPAFGPDLRRRVVAEAVEPTLRGLEAEGLGYRGVLFLGLMVTPEGCRVLEYNVRLGDPETQVLMPSLDVDWADLLWRTAQGSLSGVADPVPARSCVGVVIASPGYPGDYPKGLPVTLRPPPNATTLAFHASTARTEGGRVETRGGRCFTIVGTGDTLAQAREQAYGGMEMAHFEGAWWRKDIGVAYLKT